VPERWLQGPTGGLILGILLIVVTFVLPGGIIAGVRKIRGRFVRVLPETPELGLAGAGARVQADGGVGPTGGAAADSLTTTDES
jgi:branched-chain amino acid transport system permease protein